MRVSDPGIKSVCGFDIDDEVALKFLPFTKHRYICWLSGPKIGALYVIEERDPLGKVVFEVREDVRKMADGAIDVEDLLSELDLYLSSRAVLVYR